MSTPNDTERTELHKTIWRIANDLRGSVDGWDFKSYVLGMLFYRFISENLTAYINAFERRREGSSDFNYADLSDDIAERGRKPMVDEKGFYILPSELFVNVCACARFDENLNETLHRIFSNIEMSAAGTESERDMKGLFDDMDVNSAKLGPTVAKRNAKLVKLLHAIGDLPLHSSDDFSQHSIDLFGDAYEYLMTMYASEAGKSGGEFFTPQEVSQLLARITVVGKTSVRKVYDPACGSGSLLLQFAKVLGKDNVHQGFYGQEINLTTYNLCRINMFLHNINFERFDIAHGDTLTDPDHLDDGPFEAIVSNPPYSIKWEGKNNPLLINDPRYSPAGVLAPPSKADLAFTMHILSCLSMDGVAAIVEFPGVLYRGGAEQRIRQYLIDHNFVDAVIQLPSDLFFGTTIATCIIVLKKSKQDEGILFIDASDEFVRSGNKNKLSEENQQKILDAYTDRKSIDYFAQFVHRLDVADQDHNLAVSSYVIEEDTREKIDIKLLNAQIALIVMRQQQLRAKIQEIIVDFERRSGLNSIEALMEKLCPEGVEFKKLDQIGSTYNGLSGKNKDDFKEGNARYITYKNIFNQISVDPKSNDFVHVTEGEKQNYIELGDVLLTGSSETPNDVGMSSVVCDHPTEEIYLNSFCFGLRFKDKNLFNPEFLKYLFRCDIVRRQIVKCANGVTRFNISKKRFIKICIPVPPLALQRAIVEILDTFTALQQELEAELEARKKQYEYYREEQLSFDDDEVEWKTLGEICEVKRGSRVTKRELDDNCSFPVYSGGVTPMGYLERSNQPANTVTVVKYGTAGFVNFVREEFWANDVCYCIKPLNQGELDNKFLFYSLKNKQSTIKSLSTPAIPAHLPTEVLSNYKIPIPSLEKQKEIVAILDQFDALVNDLSIGIPTEINARRQQLEYYQNHLLTFKERA